MQANRIGTNPAGSATMGNRGDGIVLIGGADQHEIGGREYVNKATGRANNPTGSKGTTTPVFVVPPQGNLISGNGADGVLIIARADDNSLNGNFIGTSASGDHAIGNRADGILVDGTSYGTGPRSSPRSTRSAGCWPSRGRRRMDGTDC
ncbi:MAG: hypothetical protein ACYCO9_22295 [Streptosporangiaceae bacterium]